MLESKEAIERVLRALAERLDLARTPPVELAVCGGAALHARGLMTRGVTKDVDAFARVERRGRRKVLVKAVPLPDFLLREAAVVAKDFGLAKDWLNGGPDLLDHGLPKGLEGRLRAVRYGKRLAIHYLGRRDQIHFKLYAAADGAPGGRHLADLVALEPKASELESAARWAMTHDPSPGFRAMLKGCLEHIGHEEVAGRLERPLGTRASRPPVASMDAAGSAGNGVDSGQLSPGPRGAPAPGARVRAHRAAPVR